MASEITDRQRRDVAHKLRALDMSDIDVDGCIIDSTKYVGLLLMRMLDVACDYRDWLHYFPGFFSAQAVVELFADLIDRPTCRIWYVPGSADRSCSACGVTFSTGTYQGGDHEEHEFMFCPNCGSEVVSSDD